MAGLIDHVRSGALDPSDTVVFLHTGGTPALFAHVEDLAGALTPDPPASGPR
jgi:D-cysteine desulfhydrase/L-cysteate sulfo-lyase